MSRITPAALQPDIACVALGSPGASTLMKTWNAFGCRNLFAGMNSPGDTMERPFHSLDLTWSCFPGEQLTFKLRVRSLLVEALEAKQVGAALIEQDRGMTVPINAKRGALTLPTGIRPVDSAAATLERPPLTGIHSPEAGPGGHRGGHDTCGVRGQSLVRRAAGYSRSADLR